MYIQGGLRGNLPRIIVVRVHDPPKPKKNSSLCTPQQALACALRMLRSNSVEILGGFLEEREGEKILQQTVAAATSRSGAIIVEDRPPLPTLFFQFSSGGGTCDSGL